MLAWSPTRHSTQLIEALAFGAIPVILSDELVLPFAEVLDWPSFAVRWPYARASSIIPYLRTLPEERVCAMRRQARRTFDMHFATPNAQVETLLRILERQQKYQVE